MPQYYDLSRRNTELTNRTSLSGIGTTSEYDFRGYRYLTCKYKANGLTSGNTAKVRLEAKLDSTDTWTAIDEVDTDISFDKPEGGFIVPMVSFESVRFNYISTTQGTAPSIDIVFRFAS